MPTGVGLTLADLLGLTLTGVLIFVSLHSILKRNGTGSSARETGSEMEKVLRAWQALAEERGQENDVKDEHIALLMQQLSKARIEPATVAQAESIYDTIKFLADEFSMDELDTLMLSIDIYPDSIRGQTVEARARELVLAADRRGKLAALVTTARKERP